MDRPGVRQVPEGSGEQGKIGKAGCKVICGAPTTLAVKGLMMMMMMSLFSFCAPQNKTLSSVRTLQRATISILCTSGQNTLLRTQASACHYFHFVHLGTKHYPPYRFIMSIFSFCAPQDKTLFSLGNLHHVTSPILCTSVKNFSNRSLLMMSTLRTPLFSLFFYLPILLFSFYFCSFACLFVSAVFFFSPVYLGRKLMFSLCFPHDVITSFFLSQSCLRLCAVYHVSVSYQGRLDI